MGHFRAARPGDIPELMVLVHSAYRGEGSKRGWTTEADLLDGSRTNEETLLSQIESETSDILIYLEGDRMLGCILLEPVLKKGELKCKVGLLTVSPELQGKGIGKKLLEAGEKWATERGCVAQQMTVISVREELLAFYERRGFVNTGEKEPFFTDPKFGIPKVSHLEFDVLEKRLQA